MTLANTDGGSGSLMALISNMASSDAIDTQKLEKLLEIKERWEREEARKAFTRAMADFKRNAPRLVKGSSVDYQVKGGSRVSYKYVNLADILDSVLPLLASHGFSHHWEPDENAGSLGMTCILTHEDGHCERAWRSAPPDTSGLKNGIQSKASTHTYLQRYTLLDVLGMAAGSDDDDGHGFPPQQTPAPRANAAPRANDAEAYRTQVAQLQAVEEFNVELEALRAANAPNGQKRALLEAATALGLAVETTDDGARFVDPADYDIDQDTGEILDDYEDDGQQGQMLDNRVLEH